MFTYYIYFLVLILGLVIGSFLNVVGLRFLTGESIIFPPSKCPKCKTKLKWYDNIPVLAYIFLKGKCRYCKEPISIQYPVVEIITALVFLIIYLKFGFTIATLLLWILASFCVVMCITDFKEQIIFDVTSIPMIPLGLIFSFFNIGNFSSHNVQLFQTNIYFPDIFLSSLIGIILAFLFFEIISLISKILIKHRAFGEGDTIIAMIFAAWLGWKAVLITICLGFLIQAVLTFPFMILKLFRKKDLIACVSFVMLVLAAMIPLFLNQFEFFYTSLGNIILIVSTLGTATISAFVFLKRIQKLQAFTLLPFGPALIISGFIVMFFKDLIIQFIGL